MTLSEFEQLLDTGEIIEEHRVDGAQLKELVLVIDWTRPCMSWSSWTTSELRNVSLPCTSLTRASGVPIFAKGEVDALRALRQRRAASSTPRRLAERDSRTAVVLDVPVEECPACGEIWLTMDVAKRLDVLFNQLLASGTESPQIHWEQAEAA